MQREEATTLTMVVEGTPPDYDDALLEIRSPYGSKRISVYRLADILFEAREKEIVSGPCKDHFTRLINEEVARVV